MIPSPVNWSEGKNPSPVFLDNMSVVFNKNNTVIYLNKKTVALSYHFIREHVDDDVAEARKIGTKENYAYPFTNVLVSNELHGFYHTLMENR